MTSKCVVNINCTLHNPYEYQCSKICSLPYPQMHRNAAPSNLFASFEIPRLLSKCEIFGFHTDH